MSTTREMLSRTLQLRNGLSIPQIQLGLYMMSPAETKRAVRSALIAGYRGFDSAQWYGNEKETGQAINAFLADPALNKEGLTRQDIFYTTKLRSNSTSREQVRKSIQKSVKECGLGYVDLFLLHSPYGGKEARRESWAAVLEAVEAGEVKSAGVSNYGVGHLGEFEEGKRPVVNQIEVHPFNTQGEIREKCKEMGVLVEAYAPLVRGVRFSDKTVKGLAGRYGVSSAQVLVRWSIQHGFVTLPKSAKEERLISNADVGGFELSKEDMEGLDALDEKLVTDWNPTDAP
ncbi:NADP-dependent oxidoreductase domain-containing protein [Podospora australis]|uniref:NADP-dependent oxidoreductase domain-containing protein n=1 Tax=Podospora australis TaxID=1536484 RepID=A0AAN7AKU4_9PEZI|nr:NADP-dependent oxidoreductase domain-containing protein [Podospora australis]